MLVWTTESSNPAFEGSRQRPRRVQPPCSCKVGQRQAHLFLLSPRSSFKVVPPWLHHSGLLAVADKSQQETGHVNRESGLETTPPRVPCIDNFVLAYLNRPDVQAAIHANKTGSPKVWADCSSVVNYSYSDLLSSMLPIYAKLMTFSPAPRLLVYRLCAVSSPVFIFIFRSLLLFFFLVCPLSQWRCRRHCSHYGYPQLASSERTRHHIPMASMECRGSGWRLYTEI